MKYFTYSPTGTRYSLCTTKKQFDKFLRRLKCAKSDRPHYVSQGADATVHFIDTNKGISGVICLSDLQEYTKEEVYGLILHECVHLWQMIKDTIGEDAPGDEIEAYSIQSIFINIVSEYNRLTSNK